MSQSIQIPVTQVGLEQSIAAAMRRVGNSAQINLGTSSRQINALSQPLGRITGQADEFSKSMAAANARVLAFGASASIIVGVSQAMSGLLASTIKVEKSLVEINAVLGESAAGLDKFGQGIFNVAKNTGKSFEEVSNAALELARQGLSTEDTLIRLNDAMILSRLSGLEAAKSVEGLTAAFNSFKSSGISTAEILNNVVAAAQKFAVSEKDIIEGLGRSASVANLAGVSFNELASIITAIQEKTARGGAVIGNSLKTIFARIQDKSALADLQDMGIAVTNLQGEVLPALKILENLAAKMDSFSQIEKADISKKLGGIYQLDKLLAALSDLSSESSVYREALKEIEIAGNSAYKKNAVLNETLASVINKVSVSAEQLGAKLGEIGVTDSLKNLLGFFNSLLEGVQKVLGEESGLGNLVRGLVKGLGNLFAGPGLALFGAIILKLSKDLVQFGFASLKSFFGIGQAAKEVQSIESAISQVLARNVDLQQKLFQLEGNRAGQLKLITGALVEQEALLRRSANISSGLAAPLYNVGVRASDSGLRIKNKAGGYMPAVAKETQAINSGVGGARRGDKPVVIPNFNFGQGAKGTVVAHTGEYVVPNFGGGKGSAIFNRDMVQKMGLPSGARKITAAGGLIPNFALKFSAETVRQYANDIEKYKSPTKDFYQFPDGTGGYGANVRLVLSRSQSKATSNKQEKEKKISDKGFYNLDADTLGGILLVSPRFGKSKGSLDTSMPIGKIPFFNQTNAPSIDKNKYIKLKGIKTANTPSGRDLQALQGDISELFAGGIVDLAYKLYGGTFDPASGGEFANKLRSLDPSKKQQLLPAAAQGDLFEAAGKVALNSFANLESLFGSAEQSRPFDFQNASALQKMFGVSAQRGEAKRGGEKNFSSSDQVSGIVKKVFNDPEYSLTALESLRGQGAFNFSKAQKAARATNAAGGFIPNFSYQLKKYKNSDIRSIQHPETTSELNYAKGGNDKAYPYLDMVGIHSERSGQGLELFKRLGKIARRSGRKVRSSSLVPQTDRLKLLREDSNIDQILKLIYPQLSYRQKSGVKNTQLDFEFGEIEKTISGSNIFDLVKNQFKDVKSAELINAIQNRSVGFSSVIDTFAGGFIPNFAITGLDANLKNNVLAGRAFEALLRNEKSINMTENRVGPDITSGPLAIREAKLSGKSAYNDPNFGDGKPKGKNLILPSNAVKDYDDRLIKNKNADILRSNISTKRLFALASRIKTREENRKTNRNNVPLYAAGGFIPNFAKKELGYGAFGTFFSLGKRKDGKEMGIKEFRDSTTNREIEKEWLTAEYLSKYIAVPSVFFPSNKSSYKYAMEQKKIIKHVMNDPLARRSLGSPLDSLFGEKILKTAIAAKSGVTIGDLHGSNYTINDAGKKAVEKLDLSRNYNGNQAYAELGKMAGAKFSIFDVGANSLSETAFKNIEKIKAQQLRKQAAKTVSAARGFLPNFASPLQDAIGREMAAGVPASQIYIDKSPSLKNAANPMGLMVANRRDEPAGGFQGINRARREGANPMTYGAAGGFVPNYAEAGTGVSSGGISKVLVGLFAFQTAVSVATGFLEEAGEGGKKVAETLQKMAATALIFGGIAFSAPIKRLKEFSDAVWGVTRTVKQSKGGLKSGFSQGFKKGLSGEGYEFTRPTGSQARRDRLSRRYNLSDRGLSSARFGAVAGGVTRGVSAVAGSALGPAVLAIGAFKVLGQFASGFRTYSNAAAKSLGEMSVYANKAAQSLSELDRAAIEAQTNKSYGYGFDSLMGSLANITGASVIASAISGQKITNTNFQGRNLQLSNVSEEQFKQVRQAYISSYVGANRTKFKTAEDAAGKASQIFSSLVGDQFNEYDVQTVTGEIKSLSREAQKMQKENAIAEALKEAALQSEIAETDFKNLTAVLGDSEKRIKLLKQTIFDLQSSTDVFKNISEAAIDNAYNLSEYDKTIQKLGVTLESLDASSAVKQLDLVAKTQEDIFNVAKENLKSQNETVQTSGLERVFQDVRDKISSGEEIKIGGEKGAFLEMDLFRLFGQDYKKYLADLSKQFNSQTAELKNQATEAQNNANIEAHRSLLAQQTTAALESQTKQFDLQKSSVEKVYDYIEKIRNSTDKISDLNFEKGLIGATQARRLSAQIGRAPELERRAREASLSGFKQDRVGSIQSLESLIPSTLSPELQFSLKSGILEATKSVRAENSLESVSEKAVAEYNKTIKAINEAVKKESTNRQGYIDKIQNALVGSSVTFESSVISAANKFKEITASAAVIPLQNRKADLEAQRNKMPTPQALNSAEKELLNKAKLVLENLKNNYQLSDSRYLKEKNQYLKEYPNIADVFKKEEEIKKAAEAVKKLEDAIVELETQIKNFLPTPIASGGVPYFLQRPTVDSKTLKEAPAITGLPEADINEIDKALESARLAEKEALLEISNSKANAVDELEKLESVPRMLADEFTQLKEGIQATIASIISERKKSIYGAEILGANYDLETQRQLAGAKTEEEANKIIRGRKNKGLEQLFAEEYGKTPEEQSLDLKKTIVDASVQFKNNMIEGIMGAVEGTSSLKDGLRSAAYEFVKTINQRLMSNLVDQVVGGSVQSGSGQTSGGLVGFLSGMFMASGGMVNGGSGSKDDVPAMLMGGEYVVNKKAVSKYGAKFLESLNNGTLAGYAQGGLVQRGPQGNFYTPGTFGQGAIEGKKNLLDFATQTGTTGQFDKIVSQLGYQAIDLEPESSRLSVSGMRNSPQFEATQSAKQQAFDLYLQQYNQEIEAKKAAKEQKKALKRQLLMLAVTSALGAVGSVASTGAKTALANLPKDAGALQKLMTGISGAWKGGKIDGTGQMAGGLFNLFSGDFATAFRSGTPLKAGVAAGSGYGTGTSFSGNVIDNLDSPTWTTEEINKAIKNLNLGEDFDPEYPLLPTKNAATGGMIPSMSGIDTVPAMLSGGEFVMNRSAVQGIGASNLQSMNSGGTSITSEETSKKLNEQLLAKLDELISASGSTGNITINVAPSGQSSQETSQNPSEERQQLARKVKDAVLQIINDEKRIGGSLRR